jgi:hypothetical protein
MANLSVAVFSIGGGRFLVLLVDDKGLPEREPDRGKDRKGYTEAELRDALAGRYGLSFSAIEEAIAFAKDWR